LGQRFFPNCRSRPPWSDAAGSGVSRRDRGRQLLAETHVPLLVLSSLLDRTKKSTLRHGRRSVERIPTVRIAPGSRTNRKLGDAWLGINYSCETPFHETGLPPEVLIWLMAAAAPRGRAFARSAIALRADGPRLGQSDREYRCHARGPVRSTAPLDLARHLSQLWRVHFVTRSPIAAFGSRHVHLSCLLPQRRDSRIGLPRRRVRPLQSGRCCSSSSIARTRLRSGRSMAAPCIRCRGFGCR
jgi:hypothetical protein